MAVKSGAGAATNAGVTYQSTVAAYFILSVLCDFDTGLLGASRPRSISFETANPVDDINITIETSAVAYLQVKRKLSFSLSPEDDLHNCLDQFVRQWISAKDIHCLAIITSSESSKRVTVTLPSIIDAIRSGSETDFRRDQNGSLVRDYDLIIGAIKAIYESHTLKPLGHGEALTLLQKLRVFTLDMRSGSAVEQAAYMILSARNCISPALFWGNLVADCASFATSRRSLEAVFIRERYARYFSDDFSRDVDEKTSAARIFRSVIAGEISVGREIVIGTIDSTPQFPTKPGDVYVFEFYRFDEACRERITFRDGKCVLQNGLQINLLGRMATYAGLDRFIERKTEMLKSASRLLHYPANLDEDPDKSKCANERRKILAASIPEEGDHLLECVRCGNPISSNDVDYIEYVPATGVPQLGLSHQNCTLPDDRVVGAIYSEFFKKYNFLRNFDAVTWFENISRGQGGYLAMSALRGAAPLLTWSGRSARAGGTHIVEFELEGGTSEFSYHRGQLDRFPRAKAEAYCIDFNKWVIEQREKNDPLCLSQETIQFGARSTLLMTVGATETLRPIVSAHVRKYKENIARRYDVRDNWFAPVAYVRSQPDGNVVGIGPSVFLITEPLHLDRFLENWRECGLELLDYEVSIFATDDEFDEFARETFESGYHFLIDPLFAVSEELTLMSGAQLVSLENLESMSHAESVQDV